ncbi:hypothetical protein M0R04_15735 [Candidatus Dojkabacteria bacterium]|jgi:hypothetical protein|nr:hypothetical protein [Candidatus Dojkabacteria bacterium]
METKIKTIRIRYKDFKELKSLFPTKYNESLADYFGRLVEFLVVQSETK